MNNQMFKQTFERQQEVTLACVIAHLCVEYDSDIWTASLQHELLIMLGEAIFNEDETNSDRIKAALDALRDKQNDFTLEQSKAFGALYFVI